MKEDNVVPLVRWGETTPIALIQQLIARINSADVPEKVMLAVCVIEPTPRGTYTYTVTSTPMPAEVGLMAAHEVKKQMLAHMEYEEDG